MIKKLNIYKAKVLESKYKKYLPLTAFFAGFMWDSLTLKRIDNWLDNLILFVYLLLLALFIVLTNFVNKGVIKKKLFTKYADFYPMIMQFFQGGLFSAYVVFYFQSTSLSKAPIFLALLIFFLVVNEFIEDRLNNFYLQMPLLFFVSFSFLNFFMPIILGAMNVWVFILSGILSLLFLAFILFIHLKKKLIESKRQLYSISSLVLVLYLFFNLLYFLNWIPPIPLSLKHGGIYHNIEKENNVYILYHEKPKWYQFFKDSDKEYHLLKKERIYCFASIFAPTKLNKKIYHHWQQYNEKNGKWITTDKITYKIVGGRDAGYRGYTYKSYAKEGKWRVEVKTENDLLLGRISFEIISSKEKKLELEKYAY
ncbi:MAG: DUF2914 domain-containing protein [Pseudomonadota bacterium]